jgi:4-aminobutyrate aminotransferase-like enzyme
MNTEQLIQRRLKAMGPAYRLFYQQPVHLVRGEGAWLYDSDGRKYLDCYNNVASVGHCHPHVLEALTTQASMLNTHTRYLHENVVRYAERLQDTLPGSLSVCMFVCTGTEANDLAFRIARTVTGNEGAIVTEEAYHGNSIVVTKLSTEEYPAIDRPDYLEAVEAPNPYRGSYRYDEPGFGEKYACFADQAIKKLARQHDLIGDTRGKGLFHGLELVRDQASREPATEEALRVRELLRENGVLLGVTSVFDNVLKIRPPMVFSRENVDLLLDKLSQALAG